MRRASVAQIPPVGLGERAAHGARDRPRRSRRASPRCRGRPSAASRRAATSRRPARARPPGRRRRAASSSAGTYQTGSSSTRRRVQSAVVGGEHGRDAAAERVRRSPGRTVRSRRARHRRRTRRARSSGRGAAPPCPSSATVSVGQPASSSHPRTRHQPSGPELEPVDEQRALHAWSRRGAGHAGEVVVGVEAGQQRRLQDEALAEAEEDGDQVVRPGRRGIRGHAPPIGAPSVPGTGP